MTENLNPYQAPPSPVEPAAAADLNGRLEKKPLTVVDWAGAITKGVFVCGGSFLITCIGLVPSAGIFGNGWLLAVLFGFCVVFAIASGISSVLKQIHRCSYYGRAIYRSWLEELLLNISIGLITFMVLMPVTGFALIMLQSNVQGDFGGLELFPLVGVPIALAVSLLVTWRCWQPLFQKQQRRKEARCRSQI